MKCIVMGELHKLHELLEKHELVGCWTLHWCYRIVAIQRYPCDIVALGEVKKKQNVAGADQNDNVKSFCQSKQYKIWWQECTVVVGGNQQNTKYIPWPCAVNNQLLWSPLTGAFLFGKPNCNWEIQMSLLVVVLLVTLLKTIWYFVMF